MSLSEKVSDVSHGGEGIRRVERSGAEWSGAGGVREGVSE